MTDSISQSVGQSMYNFQSALNQGGSSLADFIDRHYISKWRGDALHHAMAIRTTFVNALHGYCAENGLLNMERTSICPVTDPLAHDIEHLPSIAYKGHTYVTTHSMIYAKFLACFNRRIPGVFVDSPNIRLELESPTGEQRRKYLIDFSQMDIEVRRNRGISLDAYFNDTTGVQAILREDFEKALSFFEGMVVRAVTAVAEHNAEDLSCLGVDLEVPSTPFPRFRKDEAQSRLGKSDLEKRIGRTVKGQFFWITGLLRENYDLVYPYLRPDGSTNALSNATSENVYNYDLCMQSRDAKSGTYGDAYEVLSGAIREWLFEPIVERLLDNRIISVRPVFENGNIANIDDLGSYGAFLSAVHAKDAEGYPVFPETFGGGIGIERALFALTNGPVVTKVDDITLFGKNPDSHPIYLF
ncbi:MAG: hypothetical protein GF418_02165 [Chitinivibrionales bacterium]|nr:hypothetical protein [Chitinivibrionales bacterium]MBD3394406.1 hypothetical protein [Chitinivibrionales bacterium]